MTARGESRLHPYPITTSLNSFFSGERAEWVGRNFQPNWPEGIEQSTLSVDDQLLASYVSGGKKPKPVCPHYQLVEIAGWLAGIQPEELATDPRFCGIWQEYRVEGSCGGNRRVYNGVGSAASACVTILTTLGKQLEAVEGEVDELPPPSLSDATCVVAIDRAATKKGVLEHWRQAIFELTCIPVSPFEEEGEADSHFRRISSKDGLTEEEIISKVQSISDALRNQVVGKPKAVLGEGYTAERCPVAPKSKRGHTSGPRYQIRV